MTPRPVVLTHNRLKQNFFKKRLQKHFFFITTQALEPFSKIENHQPKSNKPPNSAIMSGTEATYNITKEDVRDAQARESRANGGVIPADSTAAGLQSIVDTADKNKSQVISERQSNLPLPEQPPKTSDFNSNDASTVNVGSGGISGASDGALREPAAGQALPTGREVDGKLPNDAVAQGSKNKAGLADTTNN
ncbi:uncharacterized protein RCC_03020 [Ramularia collo-cygni]|uniref:SMP domain-containing protein n=1 Tax=Ramularia collo-cygni TaxID=112498 RepID=A0A2D3URJ6_9PEZI|nr:uncharacterized protein RCC_03020 [Ramularia collo-cygni]CZT17188.1 uncharacterized protein RCC_03020 [Ramularia collo-cygni]